MIQHNRMRVDTDGTIFWYDKEGFAHRDEDKPAIIFRDGQVEYHQHGNLHRDGNKPAIIWPDGSHSYYKNNKPCVKTIPKEISDGS